MYKIGAFLLAAAVPGFGPAQAQEAVRLVRLVLSGVRTGRAAHQQDQHPDLAQRAVGGEQFVLPLVVGQPAKV